MARRTSRREFVQVAGLAASGLMAAAAGARRSCTTGATGAEIDGRTLSRIDEWAGAICATRTMS